MEWKTIENYPNYEVSNIGTVRNKSNNRELTPDIGVLGYARVRLFKNRKCNALFIHRLVGEAFIENTNNGSQIDHIDNNKLNNNCSNLRWVSAKENISRQKGNVGASISFYKNDKRVRVSYMEGKKLIHKSWAIDKYLEAEQFYFEKCGEYEWI